MKANGSEAHDYGKIYPFNLWETVPRELVETCVPIFITGVGRSGTHFLAELFNRSLGMMAFHLDDIGNPVADSFLLYCKWYNLPIDNEGFLSSRRYLIRKAEAKGKQYVEANPYLVLSADDLLSHFPNARIIHVVRNPRKVVLSHLNKGWYKGYEPRVTKPGLIPGYQYDIKNPNHFFGRVLPQNEDEYNYWMGLSQVGKISWMWASFNLRLSQSITDEFRSRYMSINIDRLSYTVFVEIMQWLGHEEILSKGDFIKTKETRPGKTHRMEHTGWGEIEEKEFLKETGKYILFDSI